MAVKDFSTLNGSSTSFSASSDVLVLNGDASDFRFTESGSDLIVSQVSTGASVTLTGVSQEELASGQQTGTGSSANLLFTGSTGLAYFGDDVQGTSADNNGQADSGPLDLVNAAPTNLDGNNLIYGLGGGDRIEVGNGNNVVFGGMGAADSTDGSDTFIINGTDNANTSGSNLFYGNAGDDAWTFTDPIRSGQSTTIYAGQGDDTINNAAHVGNIWVAGNRGSDTINVSSQTGDSTIYGGDAEADSADSGDIISTGTGNSTVYGNGGADVITTGTVAAAKAQTVYAGQGDDQITSGASVGTQTLYGNRGADSINMSANNGSATVFGGDGSVDTADGADTFTLGANNAASSVYAYGNAGADTFNVTSALAAGETLFIHGGADADTIAFSSAAHSATANCTINGGAGDDIFNITNTGLAAAFNLNIAGFESGDTFNVSVDGGSNDAKDLTAAFTGGNLVITNTAGAAETYTFVGYTGQLTSSNFNLGTDVSLLLTNFGGSAATLAGDTGNDNLYAGDNGDTLTGGAGTDSLNGGAGADSINGGTGADTLTGGAGNDTLVGGDGAADVVNGGSGDDSITGGTTGSTLNGDSDNDIIIAGTGSDTINGGSGNDTITTDATADTVNELTGGSGADTFNYTVANTDDTLAQVDEFKDFGTGLDVFDFTDLTNSNLNGAGTDFQTGASTANLGTDTGLFVSTTASAGFSIAQIYTAIAQAADDLGTGIMYAMVSNNTDSVLVRVTDSGDNDDLTDAGDLLFVAEFTGMNSAALAALTAANFADFS